MGESVLFTPTVLFLNKELILLFYIICLKALCGSFPSINQIDIGITCAAHFS